MSRIECRSTRNGMQGAGREGVGVVLQCYKGYKGLHELQRKGAGLRNYPAKQVRAKQRAKNRERESGEAGTYYIRSS